MKVIAETASNHMGELKYLKEISIKCHEVGADMVTVQIFNLESFVSSEDELSYSNFLKVFIEEENWINYFQWCEKKGIQVLPCVLDLPSAQMCRDCGFKTIKIHASDIVNLEFLKQIDNYFDTVFLEFGGANLDEIQEALNALANTEVILLYGFNAYPTRIENQNLNFLNTLKNLFNCRTGFADHSVNNEVIPLLAMAKGALYLEKHVTLDAKNENRFDWQVSVEPRELSKMITQINNYASAFGKRIRTISESEKHFRKVIYKKLVLNKDMKKGEEINKAFLDVKRSIEGIESALLSELSGKRLNRDLKKGTAILHSDLI